MPAASDTRHVLVGTAGHIDHGKTRLVAALTGIDTDRLPEEKSRGISIDLGFARWQAPGFDFGVVDVPGHEKFVRNMVAGATGINIGLLVVAADDGVMPQTREHLDIMDLLGISRGIVAITKTDLVDAEFVELVASEVEDLVDGTFLTGCPIVPVSGHTGDGIVELQSELSKTASTIDWPETTRVFRMPIDRVFSKSGHGTVVTGSVMSGGLQPGDVVELLPDQRELRVRRVEIHGFESDTTGARRRTAINLAGVSTEELHRGQEIATPGYLEPTQRLLVEVRCLRTTRVELKDRTELDLHLGTSEVRARLATRGQRLSPGENGVVELRTLEPVVATWGQRFILRQPSPALTLAGGVVLDSGIPAGTRLRSPQELAKRLRTESGADRLAALLAQSEDALDPLLAARRVGVWPENYDACLDQLQQNGELVPIGGNAFVPVHRDRLSALTKSVLKTIREELARNQPRRSLSPQAIRSACRGIASERVLTAVIEELIEKKELKPLGPNLSPADAEANLTKKQKQALATMLDEITSAGPAPPSFKQLIATTGRSSDEVAALLNLCVEDRLLMRVSDDFHYSPTALDTVRLACAELLDDESGKTMSEIRDALGITRKHAVPLCEFLDACGVTHRDGDVRFAGPNIRDVIE